MNKNSNYLVRTQNDEIYLYNDLTILLIDVVTNKDQQVSIYEKVGMFGKDKYIPVTYDVLRARQKADSVQSISPAPISD